MHHSYLDKSVLIERWLQSSRLQPTVKKVISAARGHRRAPRVSAASMPPVRDAFSTEVWPRWCRPRSSLSARRIRRNNCVRRFMLNRLQNEMPARVFDTRRGHWNEKKIGDLKSEI